MAYSIGFDIFAKDRASKVFDHVGARAGAMAGVTSALTTKITNMASSAGRSLAEFGIDSVKAYTDAEKSQRVLTDAYQRFPALADVPLQSLRDQAQALQSVTKFDGDATAAAMGQLAAYKLTGAQVQQLTPLLLDYAQKTGKDLPTAANTLGKALLGQGRGLKDIGVNFKDTGSLAGNFAELTGKLRTQVGGFAEQEGKSAEGRAAILANKFGDLKESVGQQLLPALEGLTNAGIKLVDWLNKTPGAMTAAKVALVVLGAAIVVATGAWVAMNLAFIATPIGALITGLVLLGGALVVAYKHSQKFRDICATAFAVVKIAALGLAIAVVGYFRFMIGVWLTVAAGIVHGAAIAFGWIPGLGPKLKAADRAMTGFKDSVNTTLGKVQKKLEIQLKTATAELAASRLAAKMHQLQSKSIYIAVHYTATAGRVWDGKKYVNIGQYASGTPSAPRGWAWVGEQGPELMKLRGGETILPADESRVIASAKSAGATSAGGTVVNNIYVNGPTIGTPDTIARQIQQALLKIQRTGGVNLGLV